MDTLVNDSSVEQGRSCFAMIAIWEASVLDSDQRLFDALYFRSEMCCEIFRFPTIREANDFMWQRYYYRHYANPSLYGVQPIPLPPSAQEGYELIHPYCPSEKDFEEGQRPLFVSQPVEETLPVAQPTFMGTMQCDVMANLPVCVVDNIGNQTQPTMNRSLMDPFWAIDAMNGFGTVGGDLSEVVSTMADPDLVYPHAITVFPIPDESVVSIAARNMYVHRFYSRYDGRCESICLPKAHLPIGELFIDPHFQRREDSRQKGNLMNFLEMGIL